MRRSGWLGVDAGAPGCPPVDRDLVYGEPLITPANGLRTGCAGTKSAEGEGEGERRGGEVRGSQRLADAAGDQPKRPEM